MSVRVTITIRLAYEDTELTAAEIHGLVDEAVTNMIQPGDLDPGDLMLEDCEHSIEVMRSGLSRGRPSARVFEGPASAPREVKSKPGVKKSRGKR